MSGAVPPAQESRPRAYRRPVPTWWWLERRSYVAFMLREASSVFVAWAVVFLLLLLAALGSGAEAYAAFLDWARTPWVVALNVVTLAFVVYHAVTWFQLTPMAVAVRLRGRRVPGAAVAATAYAGWMVVSALVVWLVLSG